jgi:uncharacterized membrane protein
MPTGAPAMGMTGRPGPVNDTSKLLAALGYPIGIVAIIAILIDPYKNEKYVKFHAVQAIGLALGYFAVYIVAMIALTIISNILPLLGLLGLFLPLLGLAYFIYVILLAVKAYGGEYVEVPVVFGIVKQWIPGE